MLRNTFSLILTFTFTFILLLLSLLLPILPSRG
jgi:hypothetical protein